MLHLLYALVATARSSLKPQRELALENLALRKQLAIVQRKTKRPRPTRADRAFWVALCRLWPDWHNTLIIVKPQTVIGWHRKGFKLYWTWKIRKRTGRPPIDAEIRTVPPQNPVDRAIADVRALGIELAYPDASPAVRPARNRQVEPEAAARTRSADPRVATAAGHCAPSDISRRNTSLS
jgi:hypothetical protein